MPLCLSAALLKEADLRLRLRQASSVHFVRFSVWFSLFFLVEFVHVSAGSISAISTVPTGISIDPTGIFARVSEYESHRVRRIVIAAAQVTTLAGTGTASAINGIGVQVTFRYSPSGTKKSPDAVHKGLVLVRWRSVPARRPWPRCRQPSPEGRVNSTRVVLQRGSSFAATGSGATGSAE
jgi:hypothetical protein